MTTKRPGPSNENPAGIRAFDHREIAQLPEYAAASRALDALVHAMQREGVEIGQPAWLDAVADMAAALPFSDCCRRCDEADEADPMPISAPVAAEVGEGWVRGQYRCPRCGRSWRCGYSAAAPAFMP